MENRDKFGRFIKGHKIPLDVLEKRNKAIKASWDSGKHRGMTGKVSWNKGKKANPESIRKAVETKKRLYAEGKITPWNKGTKGLVKSWNKGISPSRETIEKIKKARAKQPPTNLGRKFSKEWLKNLSLSHKGRFTGESSHAWQGGKSFEPYSREFNNAFKEAIKMRDNDSCVICGSAKRLSVHHVDYNKLASTKENCILLCENCHGKTNFNRKQWTQFFQSLLNERYGYEYSAGLPIIKLEMENKNEV